VRALGNGIIPFLTHPITLFEAATSIFGLFLKHLRKKDYVGMALLFEVDEHSSAAFKSGEFASLLFFWHSLHLIHQHLSE